MTIGDGSWDTYTYSDGYIDRDYMYIQGQAYMMHHDFGYTEFQTGHMETKKR